MQDKEIRKILIEYLKIKHKEYRIYQEKSIGSSICDLMLVTDKLTGFEIKSDSDNYERLPRQVTAYNQFFDENYVVVGMSHAKSAESKLPPEWGILAINQYSIEVVRLCEQPNDFSFSYELDGTIEEKIEAIVRRVYRGDAVSFTPAAKKEIAKLTSLGYDKIPVCMAKTQYSFSDDMTKLGAPEGFTVTVRNVKVSAGAGFIVALTGDIMTMPGLPKAPAALKIDVDEDGKISGLF